MVLGSPAAAEGAWVPTRSFAAQSSLATPTPNNNPTDESFGAAPADVTSRYHKLPLNSPGPSLAASLPSPPPTAPPRSSTARQLDMPPRSALTSSFSVTDANNEVVCPLKNHDGSSCRKRCIGVSPPAANLSSLHQRHTSPPHKEQEGRRCADAQLLLRRRDIAPCRSISAVPTPSTTFPSSPRPRSPSS